MFDNFKAMIKNAVNTVGVPAKTIGAAEQVESPLSTEMSAAIDTWYELYINQAPWLDGHTVKSLCLPSFISGEVARQMLLELKWNITGKHDDKKDPDHKGVAVENERSKYLKAEFAKCIDQIRTKLEQGLASGGMIIYPYPNLRDGHIYFSYGMDWEIFPIAFSDDGNLADVIFRDTFVNGRDFYTRLERHTVEDNDIRITQHAFKSNNQNYVGVEVKLSEVPRWATLQAETVVKNTEGQMFGWYKVDTANTVDVDSPMGASIYSRAVDLIKEADIQYSRLLWEFEGSELAVDVDPLALRENNKGKATSPHLNERLFRSVDLGQDGTYHVFAPAIRDASLINGLNEIFKQIEDRCGLARGTISEASTEAKTATEIKVLKQRTYATVHNNQTALERALRDVVRAMDKYATLYNLAPEGDYEVSFDWDDSVITDKEQEMNELLALRAQGLVSKKEIRMWYFGETEEQAEAALQNVLDETTREQQALALAQPQPGGGENPPDVGGETKTPGSGEGGSVTSNNGEIVGTKGAGSNNRTQHQTQKGVGTPELVVD